MCLTVLRFPATKDDAVPDGKSTPDVATRHEIRIHSLVSESQQSNIHLRSVFYSHNTFATTTAVATITTARQEITAMSLQVRFDIKRDNVCTNTESVQYQGHVT